MASTLTIPGINASGNGHKVTLARRYDVTAVVSG